MPVVLHDALTAFTKAVFEASGVPGAEAAIVAASLVEANLRGHDSHGVIRIKQYLDAMREGRLHSGKPLEVLDESPALLAADAGWGLGQVQAHRLLDRLLEKARAIGVAAGTLCCCGHIGRLGEYAERAAEEQMVLIATVNSHGFGRRVAPPGGTEGRISTNPLCIGAPTSADPIILDIGTSVCAEGKVRVAHQKGESVPAGWLFDAQGRPTTDPGVLYREPCGTIRPLGGDQAYKGFGLGLILDVLAGGLSKGNCSRADVNVPAGNAVVFVLLNIARFGGQKHFLHEASLLADFVRNCPRAEGVAAIVLPGDPERQTRQARLTGGILIPDALWLQLAEYARSLGVPLPAAI